MKMEDFSNIDFNNIGNWPLPVKAVAIIILCIAVAGAYYYFVAQEQINRLDATKRKEVDLRTEFEKKQMDAARLPKLKDQLAVIDSNLQELRKQLPSKTEVAGLIQDISQQAIASGLKQELFQPDKETSKSGYIEIPIKLKLTGDYHSFAKFVSGVAAMPRIVTQHDISIKRSLTSTSKDKDKDMVMDLTAKIYRYKEEEPEEKKPEPPKPAPPAPKKK